MIIAFFSILFKFKWWIFVTWSQFLGEGFLIEKVHVIGLITRFRSPLTHILVQTETAGKEVTLDHGRSTLENVEAKFKSINSFTSLFWSLMENQISNLKIWILNLWSLKLFYVYNYGDTRLHPFLKNGISWNFNWFTHSTVCSVE